MTIVTSDEELRVIMKTMTFETSLSEQMDMSNKLPFCNFYAEVA